MTMQATRIRILVADDDAMNRLVAIESLTGTDVDIVAVECGEDVLKVLASDHFDLVLMDVHMPDMSGIEATRRIRELERERPDADTALHHLPIIAVTASATLQDQAACIAAGMDGVLTKPYRIDQLQALVVQWSRR